MDEKKPSQAAERAARVAAETAALAARVAAETAALAARVAAETAALAARVAAETAARAKDDAGLVFFAGMQSVGADYEPPPAPEPPPPPTPPTRAASPLTLGILQLPTSPTIMLLGVGNRGAALCAVAESVADRVFRAREERPNGYLVVSSTLVARRFPPRCLAGLGTERVCGGQLVEDPKQATVVCKECGHVLKDVLEREPPHHPFSAADDDNLKSLVSLQQRLAAGQSKARQSTRQKIIDTIRQAGDACAGKRARGRNGKKTTTSADFRRAIRFAACAVIPRPRLNEYAEEGIGRLVVAAAFIKAARRVRERKAAEGAAGGSYSKRRRRMY
jgi:hypothetical protein